MKAIGFMLIFTLFLPPSSALGQSTFGGIVGTATDSAGAAVPGVAIFLRSIDENTTRNVTSDEGGAFQFLNLKPGRYEVTARAQGFSDFKIREITLDSRQTLRLEVKLEVAQVGEVVQISAGETTINTENGTVGSEIKGDSLKELPLNYRGATTSPLSAIAALPDVQQDSSGNISVGGALPSQVAYSVDGISSANNRQNGSLANQYPSSEMLAEFKVTAFNNNAEFSQVGDVTITTKGGGNQFHGSLFEYAQNSALDATVYGFDSKAPKSFNTFGGSFSGPVKVPGVFDGKNRTFFFVDYEGNRRQQSAPLQFLTPTAAERAGDLSGLTSQPIINPATGAPFQGNIIPSNQISQTAKVLLANYIPLPNNNSNTNANLFLLTPTPASTNGY
ncbi:MAG TPA: carboxypeptidase-like regulatory domain-containing protein, partial [Blastocatellia bacterium]|nr:carboxypeptidase-like regulatory domain-containing protein [Blastocatellia bacterium]